MTNDAQLKKGNGGNLGFEAEKAGAGGLRESTSGAVDLL